MNGVAEALLDELLTESRAQTDVLRRMAAASGAGGGGGGGGGGGTTNYGAVGKTFNLLGAAVGVASGLIGGVFNTAIGLAGAGLTSLVDWSKRLGQAQMALAETAIAGTGSLSSFYDSLSNLPGILGLMARVFAYHTKILEVNLKTFQGLAETGATLGGNLARVRESAKGMYLSMDEFVTVMQANAPALRFLGGTADEGARNLIRFNTGLIQGNIGKQLLGMGFTLEQVNTLLGAYSQSIGGINADQIRDQKQMEKSVKFFAEELDLAAQLEGKTRKQKEDEMREASAQAAVRAKLAEMGPEEQKKYLAAYNAALRIGGKGAAEALQSQLLGLPPMTKAAQMFTAVNNEAAGTVRQLADTITDGTTALQARSRMDQLAAAGVVQSGERYKELGVAAQAATWQQGELTDTMAAAANAYSENTRLGIRNEQDALARIENTRQAQETAQQSAAGSLAQAAGAAKYQGEWLMNLLYGLFKPLEPILLGLVSAFQKAAQTVIPFATDVLTKVVIPLFNDLFGNISLADVMKPFKDFIAGFTGAAEGLSFEEVRKALFEFLNPIKNFLGDIIKTIDFKAMGAFFADIFNTIGKFARAVFNEMSTWDWKKIGSWISWSLHAIGSLISDIWSGVKAALTGEVTEGGSKIKQVFESLGIVIRKIVIIVGGLVEKFINSPLFEKMQEIVVQLFDLLGSVVDMIMAVVDSPLGGVVIEGFMNYWTFLADRISALVDIIKGVVDIVTGIILFMTGDFEAGWEKIKQGVVDIITGLVDWFVAIPVYLATQLVTGLTFIYNIITNMLTSIQTGFSNFVDSIKSFFANGIDGAVKKAWDALGKLWDSITDAISNFGKQLWERITGGEDEEEESAPATPQTQRSQPAAPAQAAPTPRAERPTPAPAQTPPAQSPPAQAQRPAAPTPAQPAPEQPAAAATTARGSGTSENDLRTLNTGITQMNRLLGQISENTKRTADLIAANGNAIRR